MDAVRVRILSQELGAPRFVGPEEVVGHFGAMQGQEYRLMRWAVAMRTKRPSYAAFKDAYDSGRIVRMHLLRGTWQLVAGEDFQWMLGLCGPSAERTIRGWMNANHISIPQDEMQQVREIMVEATHRLRSVTKEDLAAALAEKGIVMDDHRLSYHIRYAELAGVFCSGDLLPMKATYSLVCEKLRTTFSSVENNRAAALGKLAKRYFQSHSPATFGDFLWWSGLNVSDCRLGMDMLGDHLIRIPAQELSVGCKRIAAMMPNGVDEHFYILDTCRTRGFKSGRALLLPPYDEYLIGYKSRYVSLPPQFSARAHNNSGNFYPIVAHDGVVCGNWSPFARDLSVDFFSPETQPWDESTAFARYRKASAID